MKIYASFGQRIAAFMWDYLIIACYILVITGLFWLIRANEWFFTNRIQAQISVFFFLTLPVILYFSVLESSVRQATWGKHKMGLKVIDYISFFPQTNPLLINIGFGVVYLIIGLNIASLLMTETHQTIYDLLVKTYVEKQN